MNTIYLTEAGSVVRVTSNSIVVTKGRERLLQAPLFHIDRVLLFGRGIQITGDAMGALLEEGIEVSYLGRRGKLYGKVMPSVSKNVLVHVAQYERYSDDEFKANLARTLVTAKLNSCRGLIIRYRQNYADTDFSSELRVIEAALHNLPGQSTVSSIIGTEGVATAAYFRAYGRMFRKKFRFETRTRRPPKDPVNALLSFGYTMITNELFSLIAAHSLDPHIGFLHELGYGRPSLALDLVEEFRQPFIDRFTLRLVNKEVFTEADFRPVENKGVYLTKPALKVYFEQYEKRILEPFTLPNSDEQICFRELFKRQVQRILETILYNKPYEPFRIYK